MANRQLIDRLILDIKDEIEKETAFINRLKAENNKLEAECFPPLYSINPVINVGEQFIYQMRRAIAELPLEEGGND